MDHNIDRHIWPNNGGPPILRHRGRRRHRPHGLPWKLARAMGEGVQCVWQILFPDRGLLGPFSCGRGGILLIGGACHLQPPQETLDNWSWMLIHKFKFLWNKEFDFFNETVLMFCFVLSIILRIIIIKWSWLLSSYHWKKCVLIIPLMLHKIFLNWCLD